MAKPPLKRIIVLVLSLACLTLLTGEASQLSGFRKLDLRTLSLRLQTEEFARKHNQGDAIVVSKEFHQLYYFRNGRIVSNEQWNGFTYNFPVRVALASKYYKTPEGEMYIDAKNPHSRFIRFLSFSGPGAYGIHSAATKYARYLDRMEKNDPNFLFATLKDDTRGCVQVENRIIKYLYAKVDVGTPVLVMP